MRWIDPSHDVRERVKQEASTTKNPKIAPHKYLIDALDFSERRRFPAFGLRQSRFRFPKKKTHLAIIIPDADGLAFVGDVNYSF